MNTLASKVLASGMGLIMAFSLIQNPLFTVILLGLFFGIVLLGMPTHIWVLGAVISATLSRFFDHYMGAPGIINFVHFPLVFMGALHAIYADHSNSKTAKTLGIGVILILILAYTSWIVRFDQFFRPFFAWLVFCEPFLMIYALVKAPPPDFVLKRLWTSLWILFSLQIPVCLIQAALKGFGDNVQGTFAGQGAGHHVLGALSLAGTLLCISIGFEVTSKKKKWGWIFFGVFLFVLAVLSDSRQMLVAFLPAFLFLVILKRMEIVRKFLGLMVLIAILFMTIAALHPTARQAFEPEKILYGFDVKWRVFNEILRLQTEYPYSLFLGLGGGNSVGRVGFQALGAKPGSPIALLGLSPASTTLDLMRLRLYPSYAWGSSAYGPKCTWLGLYGDFGPIGLGLYLWMCIAIWRKLRRDLGWESLTARAVMIMGGFLGLTYTWLEEPGFVLPAALMIGLALVKGQTAEDRRLKTED